MAQTSCAAGVKQATNLTAARVAQQQKIKVCNEFTKVFSGSGFLNTTFPAYGSSATGYNRATSALMNRAVTGDYPDTQIAYSQVLISKGQLPSAVRAAAAKDSDGNIVFTWADNTGFGTAKANDKAVLVAYFPLLQQAAYVISNCIRKERAAVLDTHVFIGYVAETWMGFVSSDKQDAADSVYTGSISL